MVEFGAKLPSQHIYLHYLAITSARLDLCPTPRPHLLGSALGGTWGLGKRVGTKYYNNIIYCTLMRYMRGRGRI